jgi:hypothetical protein
MARLIFTQQLARFTAVPEVESAAATLRAALEDAFAVNPRLRHYVLDDQGRLRANVTIFIGTRRCQDPVLLNDPIGPQSTVYILQALSGG